MRYPLDKIYITQPYGNGHNGVDLRARTGTPLYATSDGEVLRTGYDGDGYGWYIVVKHSGYVDLYAHLREEPYFAKGDYVTEGEVLGPSGNTGRSTGPHLHYEVFSSYLNYLLRRRTDPLAYLEAKMNQYAEKYEGQSIIVPEDNGAWYWIVAGQKRYVPDHMTGWSYGLLPKDAKGVTKKVADSIPNGSQLKYWEGKYKRLIDDISDNKKYLT